MFDRETMAYRVRYTSKSPSKLDYLNSSVSFFIASIEIIAIVFGMPTILSSIIDIISISISVVVILFIALLIIIGMVQWPTSLCGISIYQTYLEYNYIYSGAIGIRKKIQINEIQRIDYVRNPEGEWDLIVFNKRMKELAVIHLNTIPKEKLTGLIDFLKRNYILTNDISSLNYRLN